MSFGFPRGAPAGLRSRQQKGVNHNMANEQEHLKKWSQFLAQVWSDEELKRRLMDNPAPVLQEYGIDVPSDIELRVVENTDKVAYLTLPSRPPGDATELTADQLGSVAGGFCCTGVFTVASCVVSKPAPTGGKGKPDIYTDRD